MARLYPTDAFECDPDSQHAAELKTLKLLASNLPNDYAVFHSQHWSNAGNKFTQFGEIDFIIVNQSGQVLAIEQKNGALQETEDGLVKHYGQKRKSVNTQIQRNIGGIMSKFSTQHGNDAKLDIDYLIYCPDHRVVSINGAGVDMCRTVDHASRENLTDRIMQLLSPGSDEDTGIRDRVLQFFAHTLHIAPDVGAFVDAQHQTYTRMLEGLSEVIDHLDFSPFRLRVVGTAGCGKTQLTLQQSSRLVEQGRRVLQLCFNRPLADKMRRLAPEGVEVDTYYGFCKSTLESFGTKVSDPTSDDPDYWRRIQEQLMTQLIPDDALYDALIVDEGQDFLQEWWDILELFLKPNAAVLWLEDPLQNLRKNPPVELPGFVAYREKCNFRTPATIAPFIKSVLGVDFNQKNQLPGLGVRAEALKDSAHLVKAVAHRIKELVKMGFNQSQIAIVSCRGIQSSALAEATKVGPYALKRFTGEYCNGEQIYTDGDITFESIYRFKGQQAPAVILVDLDARLDQSDVRRHILYCGMTRATVRLELLYTEDCPWAAEFRTNV